MFSVSHNIQEFRVAFEKLATGDMPEITMRALNDTAYDGLDAVKVAMAADFDNPTRWTLNAFMVWRADARNLKAVIKPKEAMGRRHYLKVQQAGGTRPRTGIESALISRLNYAGHIEAVTPAKGARLDANGNWSAAQRNQVLSGLKAQRDSKMNTTAASAKRAKGRAQFFVPRPGSKLSPGVYQRDGDTMSKVLHFTRSQPNYTKRIDFLKEVETKAAAVFEKHMARRLANAMRTT